MRGDKIYIPNSTENLGEPNIWTKLLDIAQEGQLGDTSKDW